jgi:hypothetical protein
VGEGIGVGETPAAPAAGAVEGPSIEGFADGVGEGVGEGELLGSWASAVVAAARLRTLRVRARTIRGKGNTGVFPEPRFGVGR